jgi:hypothetical protein
MSHLFTPRIGRDYNSERIEMRLSDEDIRKIERGHAWTAIVTDLETNQTWKVKGAACSAPNCYCDAVIVCEMVMRP